MGLQTCADMCAEGELAIAAPLDQSTAMYHACTANGPVRPVAIPLAASRASDYSRGNYFQSGIR